jgi:predicted MFS family arabinose efflux permease
VNTLGLGSEVRRSRLAIGLTVLSTTLAVLPPFLVGALSVLMRQDFQIGAKDIGMAAGVFFATTGSLARFSGPLVERIGASRGMLAASVVGSSSLLVVATADRWSMVLLGMVLGGAASALIHPAAAELLAAAVAENRLGLAFGLKQAGAPMATLLAGLALPTVGTLFGWRSTFVGASAVVGVAVVAVGLTVSRLGVRARLPDLPRGPVPRAGLRLFVVGAALGTAAGNSVGAMLVDTGVHFVGLGRAVVGYTLAGLSVVAFLTRVMLGWWADVSVGLDIRRLLVWMPGIGMLGLLLLAAPTPAVFFVGSALAFSFGWGWGGLLHYLVVFRHRDQAARVTGMLMPGFSFGAAAGPLALGFAAESFSYSVAWILGGLLFGVSAAVMHLARRAEDVELAG